MNFAIYDADAESLAWLEAAWKQLLDRQHVQAQVTRFDASDELLTAHAAHPFELVFLPQTEFSVASSLRISGRDCELIFVGAKTALPVDAVQYRPIGHLENPADESALERAFEQFWFYQQHCNRQYTVQLRDRTLPIAHSHIRFFHSDGHRVLIHTCNRQEPVVQMRKLDDVEQELAQQPYLRCHQRYLVHLPFVSRLEHQTMRLVLSDGSEVPVSKRYFGRVVDAILARNDA